MVALTGTAYVTDLMVSIPSQVGILLVEGSFAAAHVLKVVSIPSQVGILLVGEDFIKAYQALARSQYPLRWASSWWMS